ncbi:helix-turn-helix transcriptional regulator [Massilia atriviolacea]|nr:helix-turn-helix transcriptional regulator [Massilia atriviolacea]
MKPKDIVKIALQNSGLSQEDFAKLLGKSQPMLSKYISGRAIPPTDVIILCMNRCGFQLSLEISASALADRIRTDFSGTAFADVRAAINQILDSISGPNDTITYQSSRLERAKKELYETTTT